MDDSLNESTVEAGMNTVRFSPHTLCQGASRSVYRTGQRLGNGQIQRRGERPVAEMKLGLCGQVGYWHSRMVLVPSSRAGLTM